MMQTEEQGSRGKLKKSNWWWPAEAVAAGLAEAIVISLRGCWHKHMGWPVATRGGSYQVCLSCGAKRLFDETTFSAYGPFCYDLNELISRDQSIRAASHLLKNASRRT